MLEIQIDTPGTGREIERDRPAGREPSRLSVNAQLLAAHAPLLVSLVLGALITVEVARASLTLWSGGPSKMAHMQAPVSTASAPGPRPIDVRGIVAAHLFGVAVEDPNTHDDIDAPQTTAHLSLAGTLASDDPRIGFAIISDSGRATVYKVGDAVADGSLHSVYPDHVLLRRQGGLESLNLPRFRPAKPGSGAPATPASRVAAAEEGDSPEEQPKSAGDSIQGTGIATPDGRLRGYRIFPAGDHRPFDEAGLRGGDLVVAINGIPLEDQDRETGQNLFNSMKSSSQATITIDRAGQRQDVTINAAGSGAPAPSAINGSLPR